jgi:hypothetical protein
MSDPQYERDLSRILANSERAKGEIRMLINWKTTAGGVVATLAALVDVAQQLLSGHIDGGRITTDFAAISAGIGLIFAKDKNVTGAGDTAVAK